MIKLSLSLTFHFKEKTKIEVVTNPVNLLADSQGDVYLVSMGNYGDIPNTFQRIDSKTDEVNNNYGNECNGICGCRR